MTIHDKQFEQPASNKMRCSAKRRTTNLRDLTSTCVSGEIFKQKEKNKTITKPPNTINKIRERTEIVGKVTKKKRRKCSEN